MCALQKGVEKAVRKHRQVSAPTQCKRLLRPTAWLIRQHAGDFWEAHLTPQQGRMGVSAAQRSADLSGCATRRPLSLLCLCCFLNLFSQQAFRPVSQQQPDSRCCLTVPSRRRVLSAFFFYRQLSGQGGNYRCDPEIHKEDLFKKKK